MRSFDSRPAGSRRVRAALLAAVLAAAGGAGVAVAQNMGDTVWVKREKLQLREGVGAGYRVVVEAKKGEELKVINRNGKWLHVQAANGVQGWVMEDSLSVKKVSGGGGMSAFAGSDPAEMGVAAGQKGLEEETEELARIRGQDPQLVERMIAERQAAGGEWDQFMKVGGVGVYKPQQ